MALINCPDCGAQVSKSAEKCVKCGRPIKEKSANGCIWAIIVIFALAIIGAVIGGLSNEPTTRRSEPTAPDPQIRLISWTWGRIGAGSWVELSGEVENISGKKLENIKALAAFYTASGDLITSDDSMLELNPVMPGQKTPFKVLTRYNPEMEKATLRFTSIWGEPIETIEKSP